MKLMKNELVACKSDLGNERLSFIKSVGSVTYRIFVNGNDEISFWVSGLDLDKEQIMTVSRDMFYWVFDITVCNKIFSILFNRYLDLEGRL